LTKTELDICVDTVAGARAALAGGADRVELCSSLSEGGLTPSHGSMRAAARLDIACYAMIRPRSGLFHFSADEVTIMLADVDTARKAGLAGVVPGVQASDGGLDAENVAALVREAGVTEVHAACLSPADGARAFSDFNPPGGRLVTDSLKVWAMVEALA